MLGNTIPTFASLEPVHFFSREGAKPVSVTVVEWRDAIARAVSGEWTDLRRRAVEWHQAAIKKRSPAEFRKWDAIRSEAMEIVAPFVSRKTKEASTRLIVPPQITEVVQHDMLHLAMEAEFADVFAPAFYASLAYWYREGRFPCGWEGAFPKGHIIVY